MAQRVITELIDDLDGSTATQTVTLSLDGVDYEIDLNDTNAADLRSALAKFADKGRRTGGRKLSITELKATGPTTKDIRAWALGEGLEVNARGRLQASVVEAFIAAG